MTHFRSDRRLADRYKVKTPLRVRLWKSAVPDCAAESVNLSQRGIYFATDSELREGEAIEVFFNMPEEIIGEPTSEWRCTGHVVRVEREKEQRGKLGVGVQFDCYEVSRSAPVDEAIEMGAPARMLCDVAPNGERIVHGKTSDYCGRRTSHLRTDRESFELDGHRIAGRDEERGSAGNPAAR